MFIRSRCAVIVAGAVVASALSSVPAQAAAQQAHVSIYGPVNENVTFVAAGFVSPIKIGRRVDLQVKSGSRWKVVDTVKQDQYGGLNFAAKLKRTSKAKDARGYEWRYLRARARATGGLKEKVSATHKVKVMLDPLVYYRVLKSSVQHTEDATRAINGCQVVTSMSATRKTDSSLGRAETGKPRWKAKRLANGTVEAMVAPGLATTWRQELKGCRWAPEPAACTVTKVEHPTGNGRQDLNVRVQVPKRGSGSVLFFTRGVDVGYPSADDSVCNVPWIRSGEVPVRTRMKKVSRSTLLGKRPFTVMVQGNAAWTKDTISGQPADIALRFTESITLQRVNASGKPFK